MRTPRSLTMAMITVLVTALVVAVRVPAQAATDWTVGPTGDYTTIVAAIADTGSVLAGDRLLVSAGTYTGAITIDRNLVIHAVEPGVTITTYNGTVVTVASGVTADILGATITGGAGTSEVVSDCGGPTGPDCTRVKGGGILNNGVLFLANVRITGNEVALPGEFVPNVGAGIWNGPTGHLTLVETEVDNNTASYQGGGLFNDAGTVLIDLVQFHDNATDTTDATFLNRGGALYSTGGTVTITDSTFSGNIARTDGGAIAVAGGSVEVTDTEFSGNSIDPDGFGLGGALFLEGSTATVTLDGVTALSNGATAQFGGFASVNDGATLDISDSALVSNQADGAGGAIASNGSTVAIINTTISNNTADSGAAIWSAGTDATLTINNATITDNRATGLPGGLRHGDGTVTIANTILQGNLEDSDGVAAPSDCASDFSGTVTSGGHNLFGEVGTCNVVPDSTDQVDVADAGLGTMIDDGIFPPMHRPLLGSPAVDAGSPDIPGSGPGACAPTDQRGVVRPQGSQCDIGAIEARADELTIQALIDAAIPGDTVTVPAGTYVENLVIDKILTLEADGPVIVDGNAAGPVVTLNGMPAASLIGLELTNGVATTGGGIQANGVGTLTVISSRIEGNVADEGGGISFDGNDLTLDDTYVIDNTATTGDGGGIHVAAGTLEITTGIIEGNEASAGDGGGVAADMEATLTGAQFMSNTSGGAGGAASIMGDATIDGVIAVTNQATLDGGAFDLHGFSTVSGSSIVDNEAFDHGGGIHATGDLSVEASTIRVNRSGDNGGGINAEAALFITDSVIQSNAASVRGGGVYATGAMEITGSTFHLNVSFLGGGVADYTIGPAYITDSTFSANTAADHGGGIYKAGTGVTQLINVTIADNEASEGVGVGGGISVAAGAGGLVLRDSLVATNRADTSGPDCAGTVAGTYTLLGAGDTTGTATPATGCGLTDGVDGNQVGHLDNPIDPVIGALGFNPPGNPTATHALFPGSPAIDAGNPLTPGSGEVTCTPLSQNGVDRAAAGPNSCDIGAYELPGGFGGPLSLSFTVDQPNPTVGVSSLATADIPAEALTRGVDNGSVIATTEIGSIAGSPINSIPINSIPINSIPINSIPINSIAGQALDSILLSDVPVEGGWESLLAGSSLTAPPYTYSFLDAISEPVVRDNIADRDLDLADYGLAATPINSIPIAAVALGATPINSIPINSIPINSIELVQEWCDLLAGSPADCNTLGIDPQDPSSADGTNLLTLSLAAAPINSIPINSIPINSIPINSIPINSIPINSIYPRDTPINSIVLIATPINSIPINSIDLAASPINSIPINSIPINSIGVVIDCDLVDCASAITFAEVPVQALTGTFGQLVHLLLNETSTLDGVTLADILQGLPAETSLADLLALLVPPQEYPWERLELDVAQLATYSAAPGTVTYTAATDLSEASPGDPATISVTVPTGFSYLAGSTAWTPMPTGAPTDPVVTGSELTWTLPDAGTVTTTELSFTVATGLRLGPSATSATVSLDAVGQTATSATTTTLQEALEPNDTPATATVAVPDTLYLSHMSSAADLDYFVLEDVPAGATIEATLGNLPADYDLVVYGPPVSPLRGDPERTVVGVADDELDVLTPEAAQPEVVADIPLTGLPIIAMSTSRGNDDEHLESRPVAASGDYIVQVSGYNGATSNDPYTLQLVVTPGPSIDECTAVAPTGGTPATLPTSLPADVNTLFLLDQQRYEATHGATALTDLLDSLATIVDQPGLGVVGAVIPVEGDADVAQARDTLDVNPCSFEAANGLASTIADLVDAYRATHPTIEYVVIIGGDDQVPQFRLPDRTRIANETSYANALAGAMTPQTAAFAAGYHLSDDPYGDAHPLLANGREIFVPEVAIGRLVETPTDIVATLDRFVTHNGLLDPTTTTSAFVSGYDFLTDGAAAVANELDDTGRPVEALISDDWNAAALGVGLLTGSRTVASINAHFDHNRAQPADLGSALFDVADVVASGGDTLDQTIVFSMGCHAGLSIPDIQIGGNLDAVDWAQTMSAQGATFVANTGYGYGETDTVALSEELMRLFADNLDGAMTVGQALQYAKHRYTAAALLYGAYDDKVLMEATFYGLPFYTVGAGGNPPPAATPPPLTVDPDTGLSVSNVSTPLAVGTDLVLQGGDRGDFYAWDPGDGQLGTQVTPFRPIQPKVEIDVTQGGGLIARGALITGLSSVDFDPFDPVVARPTVALGENEPEPVSPGVFPSALQAINHYQLPSGPRDQLVLVPGQFRSKTATTGVQRLFTQIATTVFYAPSGTTDVTAPTIARTTALEFGDTGNVTFEVAVSDTEGAVTKVLVLVRDPADGTWRAVWLVQDSSGTWGGSVAIDGAEAEYFVQAVDAAGNVAVSSNKGALFLSEVPDEAGSGILAQVSGTQVNGWYDGSVTVTLAPPALPGGGGAGIVAYDLDGTGLVTYTGPFEVTGDGTHILTVIPSSGDPETIGIPIDTEAPVIVSPIDGAVYAVGQAVTVDYACNDAASGIVSCVSSLAIGEPLPTGSSGSFEVTATDSTGKTATATISWTVMAPPVAVINGAAGTVTEGTTISLTSGTDGVTRWQWSVSRDGGLVTTGDGSTLTFVASDDGDWEVALAVTVDGVTGPPATVSFTTTNVAPTIALSGDTTVPIDEAYTLTLGPVLDPGTDNAYRYDVDWGDSTVETLTDLGLASHTWSSTGPTQVSVDVTDEDGTFQAAGTLDVEVTGPSVPMCDGRVATILGTTGDDVLDGTGGADVIIGLGGNDRIDGNGGNDRICTGAGDDRIDAGSGSDWVDAGDGDNVVAGGSGRGTITTGIGADEIAGGSGRDTIVSGAGSDEVQGGSSADVITGGDGDDEIDGGSSNDQLFGEGGDDTLKGGSGNDIIDGGPGDNTIHGGSGTDTCTSGAMASCEVT